MVIPLNSGAAISLAPGESSGPLDDVETTANPKIQKMTDAGLITVAEAKGRGRDEGDSPERGTRKKSKD